MHEKEWLAERFEEDRGHLRAVAYRMLGSSAEADDAVQEAWLKLNRTDATSIENLRAWLTTVVARVCLDMLRSRNSRREDSQEAQTNEPAVERGTASDPERETLLAESVGLALMVVLERLDPAERIAFVLHDTFGVPFDEIAAIVGRSEDATRQLASRARRRVRGTESTAASDLTAQRHVVDQFLAAMRSADFNALLAVLDPEVVVRAESPDGAVREIRGATAWAKGAVQFARQVRFMQPAMVGGGVGIVLAPGGKLMRAVRFTYRDGKIVEVEIIGDPERLKELELAALEGE